MLERLKVSNDGHFLVTEGGRPFFWLGDTAWELFHRCTREEAVHYLRTRQHQGFNVVQAVALAELDGLRVPNPYGEVPLHDLDPTRPNEAYFQYVEEIIALAAAHGIYIALLPTWGDKVNLKWGAGPVIFDPQSAYVYGEWIGRRYASRSNVLWVNGGDREEITNGMDYRPVWRALAAGIHAAYQQLDLDAPLMTYHPQGWRGSSMAFHDDDWLSFNMWQSGHSERDTPIWEWIGQDYRRRPTKPVLDGEPNYEGHPLFSDKSQYFSTHDVRKAVYRSVFAGGCGVTYGHHSVWQMVTPDREPINAPACPSWQEALDFPAAGQMIHLKRLIESRPFLSRIPDQGVLRSEAGHGGQHICATRDANGSYAMIYVPDSGHTVEFNTETLAGNRLIAWCYDPRTGEADEIARLQRGEIGSITTPEDGPDWVLVLDDESQGFGKPGTRQG